MSAVENRSIGTKKSDSFLSGVMVLSLSAVIVKIIGLVYKIPMLRLLGSEGMGYFNSAYEIYTLFCTVATTGLPVAMSVMISSFKDTDEGGKRIFRVALRLFLILGALGCFIMLAFARPFAAFLGSDRAAICILAIAPTVLLICVSSAYRGFFQGKGRMTPTAVSQVIEALGKLILGLIFAFVALSFGASTETVAAMAVMGLTLGTAVSALYLALVKRFADKRAPSIEVAAGERVLPTLLWTAIPVTLSSSVVSITKVIDMSMILRRLQDLGQSSEQAFSAYGSYTTLALPLFSLAPALITSVAMPLIPSLSGAVARGDREGQMSAVEDALRVTALISMPVSVGLALFSKPILRLIFSGEDAAIEVSAPLLTVLSLSVTASCLITVGNAVLQAYRKPTVPIISMAAGSVAKIVIAFFLIGDARIGLIGAPISTFVCDFVINAINFYFIGRCLPEPPSISRVFLRPFLSAAVSVSVARLVYNLLCSKLGEGSALTLGAVILAAALYLVASLVSGSVSKDDISRLPVIGSVYEKIK